MSPRLSPMELARLAAAVCEGRPATEEGGREAASVLYRLLAAGGPVTAERLAAALGWDAARAERLLDALPNVERDADGAVVGCGGLTLRPTGHEIAVAGQTRYAWCAWDSLFLPVALGTEARVTSECPQTGRPVTLVVTPTDVRERDPDGVVVSFVQPEAVDAADVRASFCGAVHFLADTTAAAQWTEGHTDRLVLDVDDAFELGRQMLLECGPTPPRATSCGT